MKKTSKKYKYLFIVIGIICLILLGNYDDHFYTFYFGIFLGLFLAKTLPKTFGIIGSDIIHIDDDNIEESLNDLEDRMDLIEEFVLSSNDRHLKKEYERIRQWDEDDWQVNWETRNKQK